VKECPKTTVQTQTKFKSFSFTRHKPHTISFEFLFMDGFFLITIQQTWCAKKTLIKIDKLSLERGEGFSNTI